MLCRSQQIGSVFTVCFPEFLFRECHERVGVLRERRAQMSLQDLDPAQVFIGTTKVFCFMVFRIGVFRYCLLAAFFTGI